MGTPGKQKLCLLRIWFCVQCFSNWCLVHSGVQHMFVEYVNDFGLPCFSRFRKPPESLPTPSLTSTMRESSYFSRHCPHNRNHSHWSHHEQTHLNPIFLPHCRVCSPARHWTHPISQILPLPWPQRLWLPHLSLLLNIHKLLFLPFLWGSHSTYISSSLVLLSDLKSS